MLAAVLVVWLSLVAASSSSPTLSPAPRQLQQLGGPPVKMGGWPVGATADVSATANLIAVLTKSKVGSVAGLPPTKFIALGVLPPAVRGDGGARPSAFAALAAKHNVTAADVSALGDEGYILQILPDVVLLAAQTPAGVFYGYHTLRQVVQAGDSVPSLRIVDWPSTGVRTRAHPVHQPARGRCTL